MNRFPLIVCLFAVLILVGCAGAGGGAASEGGESDDGDGDGQPPVENPVENPVEPAPPNARFEILTPAEAIQVGTLVEFDASASDDGDGQGAVVHYLWDFDYDEESGFRSSKRSSEPVTSRIFHYPRPFTVGLIVIDSDDLQSEAVIKDLSVADAEGAVIIVQ